MVAIRQVGQNIGTSYMRESTQGFTLLLANRKYQKEGSKLFKSQRRSNSVVNNIEKSDHGQLRRSLHEPSKARHTTNIDDL